MTHLLQYFPQLSLRPGNIPELRKLILQLAVEGKLTAEWRKENPDVEPAYRAAVSYTNGKGGVGEGEED